MLLLKARMCLQKLCDPAHSIRSHLIYIDNWNKSDLQPNGCLIEVLGRKEDNFSYFFITHVQWIS